METNNVNLNVKELTDEQLNKVAGGLGRVLPTCVYFSIPGCVNMDKECHCTKCAEGYVHVSGICQIQG